MGFELIRLPDTVLGLNASYGNSTGTSYSAQLANGTAGSILIEAGKPGVIGDVIFGDPIKADFAAALPLQTVLFTKAVFSQVANGSVDPSNPSMNMFTGIALFNPNTQSASVTVSVFDREGKLVGTAQIELGPNQRLSDTVENLIPDSSGLLRGYIIIDSTQPLVAQQLFGNNTLEFLSAVPPTVVE